MEEMLFNKITPKNDVVFKRIFGKKGNESILKDFLESVLEIEIESLSVDVGTEFIPDFYGEKTSRLDVVTRLSDGTIVNIEIQTNMQDFSDKRQLSYWSNLYLRQFQRGEAYTVANKTICIWILDGEVYNFPKYHSKWKIKEDESNVKNSFDDFEIHIIELKKFRKLDIMKPKKKEFWLWFIDHTKKELVDMSYTLDEVRKAKEEYEKMLETNESYKYILMFEDLAAMDEATRRENAKREGLAEGRAEGKAEGRIEGRIEGEEKANKKIAKKMIELGLDIKIIEQTTGLSKEEIEKINLDLE